MLLATPWIMVLITVVTPAGLVKPAGVCNRFNVALFHSDDFHPHINHITYQSRTKRLYYIYRGRLIRVSFTDLADPHILADISTDATGVAITPDEQVAFVSHFEPCLSAWNLTTGRVTAKTTKVTGGQLSIALSASGTSVRCIGSRQPFTEFATNFGIIRQSRSVISQFASATFLPLTDEVFISGHRLVSCETGREAWNISGAPTWGQARFDTTTRLMVTGSADIDRRGGLALVERASGQVTNWLPAPRLRQVTDNPPINLEYATTFCGEHDGLVATGTMAGYLVVVPIHRRGPTLVWSLPGQASATSICRIDSANLAVGTSDGKLYTVRLRHDLPLFDPRDRPSADPAADLAVLFGPDAQKGYARVPALVLAGDRTVAALKPRLKPVPVVPPADITAAIDRLADRKFAVRQAAAAALEGFGDQALGPVVAAKPTDPEVVAALDRLKGKLAKYTPDHAVVSRACHVLRLIDTPAAVAVLRDLAGGAPADRRTMDAKKTLEVLEADRAAAKP